MFRMRKIDIERVESIFTSIASPVCEYSHSALFAAAAAADEIGSVDASEDLRLLGHVSSMMLRANNVHEPFAPVMEMEGRRSAIPGDFTDVELERLAAIVDEIKLPDLRARVADVLWIRKKNRPSQMARLAIKMYMESAKHLLDEDLWTLADDRLSRALRLARNLGVTGQDLLDEVVDHVQSCLDRPDILGNTPFPAHLLQLMVDTRSGEPTSLLARARSLAEVAETARNWDLARTYREISLRLAARLDDRAAQREGLEKISDGYANLAHAIFDGGQGSGLVAAHWMHCAVVVYQKVPNLDPIRRDELYRTLREYQKASLKEMTKIQHSTDGTEMAELARAEVTKESLLEALMSLAFLISSPDYDELRENAKKRREKYPLQSLFSPMHLDYEGKIVARIPPGWTGCDDEAAKALWAGTLQEAELSHSIDAQALIEPARQKILLDHFVQLEDFFSVVVNNPIIPVGHQLLWAKGLYAGLTGDFAIAAHMLVPQLENSLRHILQMRDVITSELKPWGLQEDQRLGGLLRNDELTNALGKDFVLDLRAILVEPTYTNLRNKIAHGLASEGELYAPTAVYFWWLCLRLCLLPCKTNVDQEQQSFI